MFATTVSAPFRGKGGKTKEKIARVSEAEIELFERDLILEFRGSKMQRRRAKKYAEGVMAQRTGPVNINSDFDDGDMTMLSVAGSGEGVNVRCRGGVAIGEAGLRRDTLAGMVPARRVEGRLPGEGRQNSLCELRKGWAHKWQTLLHNADGDLAHFPSAHRNVFRFAGA